MSDALPDYVAGVVLTRPAPRCWRDDRGELDIERITLSWLGWRRLEWNGADPGGAHTLDVGYSRGAMFRPGSGRCNVELHDRAGRHVPKDERVWHTVSKAWATFHEAGFF